MINEEIFWEIIQQNAQHIKVLNSEMGAVIAILSFHTKLILGLFSFLGTIFITNLIHLRLTKKNGNNKK